jgi:shikimate dehydrogenase
MRKYGLIGESLEHSFSPQYFETKFLMDEIVDAEYKLYPMKAEDIEGFLSSTDLEGFNVTFPFKREIIQYLDEVDPIAFEMGAVNTVKRIADGWKGYNTDYIGFTESIKIFLDRDLKKALILGTGGASLAVKKALDELDIAYNIVSRTPEDAEWPYEKLTPEVFKKFGLIINCTPLGTFPKVDESPNIPYDSLNEDQLLYDLVYNPEVTLFMREGMKKGCRVKNGYEMLMNQAEASWTIWTTEES